MLVTPPDGWTSPDAVQRSYRDRDVHDAALEGYWIAHVGATRARGLSADSKAFNLAVFSALLLCGGRPLTELHWTHNDLVCERVYVATAAQIANVVRVAYPQYATRSTRAVQSAIRWLCGSERTSPTPAALVKVREGNEAGGHRTPPAYILPSVDCIAPRGAQPTQAALAAMEATARQAMPLASREGDEGPDRWHDIAGLYLTRATRVLGRTYILHDDDRTRAHAACQRLVMHDGWTWDDLYEAMMAYLDKWERQDKQGNKLKTISRFFLGLTAGGGVDHDWGVQAFLPQDRGPWPELKGYHLIETSPRQWEWTYATMAWDTSVRNYLPTAAGMDRADAWTELARWYHTPSASSEFRTFFARKEAEYAAAQAAMAQDMQDATDDDSQNSDGEQDDNQAQPSSAAAPATDAPPSAVMDPAPPASTPPGPKVYQAAEARPLDAQGQEAEDAADLDAYIDRLIASGTTISGTVLAVCRRRIGRIPDRLLEAYSRVPRPPRDLPDGTAQSS